MSECSELQMRGGLAMITKVSKNKNARMGKKSVGTKDLWERELFHRVYLNQNQERVQRKKSCVKIKRDRVSYPKSHLTNSGGEDFLEHA